MAHVADHADHPHRQTLVAAVVGQGDELAERLPVQVARGEAGADHADPLGAGHIAVGDPAPGQQGDAEHIQELRRGQPVLAVDGGPIVDLHAPAQLRGRWRIGRNPHAFDARYLLQPRDDATGLLHRSGRGDIALLHRRQGEHHRRAALEAHRHLRQLLQGAGEQRRADQQHHGDRHLRDHQDTTEAAGLQAPAAATAADQFHHQVAAATADDAQRCGQQRRRATGEQREQHAGTGQVRRRAAHPHQRHPVAEQAQAKPGQRQAGQAAEGADQHAFGQRRQAQPQPRGAQCGTHRAVVTAPERAQHHQAGQVDRGDRQHAGGRGEEQPQRVAAIGVVQAVLQRQRIGRPSLQGRPPRRVHVRAVAQKGLQRRRGLRGRRGHADPGSQPRHHDLVGGQVGRSQVRLHVADQVERFGPGEVRRQYADDLHRLAFHLQGTPHRRRIAAEIALPEAVAEDHRLRPARPAFLVAEVAPRRHRQAKRAQDAGIGTDRGNHLAGIAAGDVGRHRKRAQDADRLQARHAPQHRVVAGCRDIAARVAGQAEGDQPLRLRERQRLQQGLVEQREHRGGGGHAQRQGQHRQ